MTILGTIIFIILGLLFGALVGWLLAKWKIHRMTKKIDKEINLPENIQKVNEMFMDQKLATMKREVRDNDRRRNEFRGYGDRRLIPIDLGAGESGTQGQSKYNDAPAGDIPGSKLQDEDVRNTGGDSDRDEKPARDTEEDWPDFS